MCQYSLYVGKDKTRKVVAGETLTVSQMNGHAVLLTKDGKVGCVTAGTKLVARKLALGKGMEHYEQYLPKTKVTTLKMVVFSGGSYAADGFASCGQNIHIGWLKAGTKFKVWKARVRKPKAKAITGKPGMKVVEAAIDEATRTNTDKVKTLTLVPKRGEQV